MIGIIPVPMLMECPCPNDAGNDYASSNDAGNGMMLGIMPVPMLMVMMTVSKNDAAGNSFAAFAVGNNDADKTAPTADGNNSHFLMPVRIPLLLEMLRRMPLGMLIMLL